MRTEGARTKGSSGALISSATGGVGGGEGHDRQVRSVRKGKGCGDPRSPHIVWGSSKIQVQAVLHCLGLSFLLYGKEIKTPLLPIQDDLHRSPPPPPTWTLQSRAEPNSALSLNSSTILLAGLRGPGYARLFMTPCRYLSWQSSVEGDGWSLGFYPSVTWLQSLKRF